VDAELQPSTRSKWNTSACWIQGACLYFEIDPVGTLQACREGFRVVAVEAMFGEIIIFAATTENLKVITVEHIGLVEIEVKRAASESSPGRRWRTSCLTSTALCSQIMLTSGR
jgi:hypothetical protein